MTADHLCISAFCLAYLLYRANNYIALSFSLDNSHNEFFTISIEHNCKVGSWQFLAWIIIQCSSIYILTITRNELGEILLNDASAYSYICLTQYATFHISLFYMPLIEFKEVSYIL